MKILKQILILLAVIVCLDLKAIATINVAFTIDDKYPIYTLLTINSILMNNKSNSDYTFWIVEDNVSQKNKDFMKQYVENRNQKINFVHISMDKVDKGEHLFKDSMWASHVSRIGNARLVLPEILPKNIDKILYMDSDTLVISDLKELYNTDIRNYAAAMARNNSDVFDQVPENKPSYFNSGVILINANYWRRMNASQKMVQYIQHNNLQFPDQDAVNKVLYGKIKKLPQRWNNQTSNLGWPLANPKLGGILHFIGGLKPWHVQAHYSPETALYYEYWKSSGLTKYQMSKWRVLILYYKHAGRVFCNHIFS